MSRSIPTGKTYLGFVLLWGAVIPVVLILCVVLFAAGQVMAGILTILLTGYGYFCHSSSIGQRAQQGIRRPSPELRRIMAIDRQKKATEGG